MRPLINVVVAMAVSASVACGKESAPGSPSPALTTETFSGAARAIGPGSCTGDFHTFVAQPGMIAVTLIQTSPAENMTVQICSTNSATDCSMSRRPINVGQTLEVVRNSFTSQTLSLLPLTCGTNAAPSPSPISYDVTVRYLK